MTRYSRYGRRRQKAPTQCGSIWSRARFFSGPLTGQLDTSLFYPPPGIDHLLFDLTIVKRYDHPDQTPAGFADIGVTIFGVAQIGGAAIQAQTGGTSQLPIGSLEPGTYPNMRINLINSATTMILQPGPTTTPSATGQ